MSLSYEQSLQAVSTEETIVKGTENPVALMSLASTLSSSDDWIAITDQGYRFYNNEYSDNGYSSVDELKNINLNANQFNITQEQNSQYIPFQIPRYYDGFDLTKTKLSIYYINKNKEFHSDVPVDVYYNNDSIRFAWLVSEFATQVAGTLQFEIHARGINNKNETYVWKSKSTDKLNVLQSLENVAAEEIGLSEEEVESWYNKIQLESQSAQEAAVSAQEAAEEAASLVATLQDGIATEVETAVNNVVDTVIDGKISDQLLNYYTKAETYDRDEIDEKIDAVKPEGYATIEYVDQQIDSIDVTEQLDDYALKTDVTTMIAANPQEFATKQEVADAIAAEDITTKLGNYYTKEETYNKSEVDGLLDTVEVDLTGYATETYVNNKTDVLSSSVETNTKSISSLSTTVGDLQNVVNNIDKSPNKTYDASYNDLEDPNGGENVFVLYEITGEGTDAESKEPKAKFTITGGSGGGSGSSLKIGLVEGYKSPIVATINDKVIIKYIFSGTDSSGDAISDGNYTWKIGTRIIAQGICTDGENTFDATEFVQLGSQKLSLAITDDAGSLVTKSWTVQKIDVRLESNFNDEYTYNIGEISFDYTPYGAIEKEIHFILDGEKLESVHTQTSGIPMSYILPEKNHGAHLLESYITTTINNKPIESNHIFKDILYYDATSTTPIIGCANTSIKAKQYDSSNIKYVVYDPDTETPKVTLAVDGNVVSELTLDKNVNTWQYKTADVGTHTLTITCGETVKTIIVEVEKLDIDVNPVTANLAFDFNPVGYSNSDADRLWSDKDITMTVSENFDWTNGGYQVDENGDQYFCVKSGTSATINYNLFADDPKKNGKEFKLIFKTTNVKNRATTFLSCMNNNIGIDMSVESANIYSSNGSLYSPYCEDDIIEFEFNINKDTDIPMVLTYEDGVGNRPMIYSADSSFMQLQPQPITIGSDDCDVHIYRMKAYTASLSDIDVKSNFIADARNADEMITRHRRNDIYDENGLLTPEVLAEKCPDLRIILIDAPWFTNDKDDKVADTTIQMIYKGGDPVLDNWTCINASHSGQGTSSNEYGYAGRNLRLIMNNDDSLFTFNGTDEDGNPLTGKEITLTRDSIPNAFYNIKVKYLPLYMATYIE